ncbi:YoaK family protein [Streptomyces sp. XH2]|uniref:YoaK family protein n=1 Tax=Streptomyces sp. XH2 TaxID=3412483 RepID=UPI003C7C745C
MRQVLERVLQRAADRLFPDGTNAHGALPAVLVVLTLATGIVDAVSFLGLHHVFVANMTGNVVFLGFSLAGGGEPSVRASLLALGAFSAGAWAAGRLGRRVPHRARLFAALTAVHAGLVAAALAVALTAGHRTAAAQTALIALLGCGMGLQNAAVRALAVPDLTTTVLTRTLTGLAADAPGPATVRRLASLTAMFTGALCGGALFLREGVAPALAPALVLVLFTAAAAPVRGGGR